MSILSLRGLLAKWTHQQPPPRGRPFILCVHVILHSGITPTLSGHIPHITYPGVDTRSGSVFCADCDDFIYDAAIDGVYLSTVVLIEEQMTQFQGKHVLDELPAR